MVNDEKVLYEELRPKEFLERLNKCPVAYLPLGTLEWHGLHLPLGADGLQSIGFFKKLAHKLGGIVLPMLFLGPDKSLTRSEDNKKFYGMDNYSFQENYPQQLEGSSYYVDNHFFEQLIKVTLKNLERAGFKIVVAHGHGPSTDFVRKNRGQLEQECNVKIRTLHPEQEDDSDTSKCRIQSDHAAFNETSLTMALRPELVDMNEISGDGVPIGVWGEDPRIRASEEIGHMIIEKNLNRMEHFLTDELSKIDWEKRKMNYHHVDSNRLEE